MDEGGDDAARPTLNEAKTSLKNARQERFDFLGYLVRTSPLQKRTVIGI